MIRLPALATWVASVDELTTPERFHWCDGSAAENAALTAAMLEDGTPHKLS